VVNADFEAKDKSEKPSKAPDTVEEPVVEPEPPQPPSEPSEAGPAGGKTTTTYVNEIAEHCTFINNMFGEERAVEELKKASTVGGNEGFASAKRLIEVHNNGKLSFKWAKVIAHKLRAVAEDMVKAGA